jgi:peptide/nickel transport system substrate-binding protein
MLKRLDEMGLDERDDDGFRLGPDGERFTVPFELHDHAEETIPMGELFAEHWINVGVQTTVRPVDASVASERRELNELMAGTRPLHYPIWGSAGWDDYLPGYYVGPLWQEWYETYGESGEEPPDEIKELFDLHADFMIAPVGSPEFDQVRDAIVAHHAEHIWNFCPVQRLYLPTFWTSRIKNVPEGRDKGDLYGIIATFSMEQWYIEE